MRIAWIVTVLWAGLGLHGLSGAVAAGVQAGGLAAVDTNGVMRWRDSGAEVALFGVNYYAPFWHNYPDLKAVGAAHKQAIDHDVAHFARLGLDALRLHVFDREVSDREGNLLENEHLELLDYLVERAAARGIHTVLTPIAWWPVPGDSPGFATQFTMQQMTTDARARRLQTNYLAQFARHTNRFTGRSYARDPAVVAFELINEPLYPEGTADAQVIEYINALADALRAAGCRQPLFYNGWLRRLPCVAAARVDGSSFGWYPSGLVAGRSLRQNFLPAVNEYGGNNPWNPPMRALAGKVRIVYEFDAADIPGSYIYPAMARAFRSGGAQVATQFQYDPLPLAPFNQGWQTHYLNLVCSPAKAVSFLIAAEAFRRLPRLQDYGPYPQSSRFPPFRVSHEEDLSEMITEREFFHSNTTDTRPPAPERLERIVGCGSSPVARYEGTGAYFIEKLSPGVWRLEVYPDAVWVNDPYGPHRLDREVSRILWREWPMDLRLPDLGEFFHVEPLNAGNSHSAQARQGRFAARPGVFRLAREKNPGAEWRSARLPAAVGLDEFIAPAAANRAPAVWHEPRRTWIEQKPLSVHFTVALAEEPEEVRLRLVRPGIAPPQTASLRLTRAGAYRYSGVAPAEWLAPGKAAYRLEVQAGGKRHTFPAAESPEAQGWELTVAATNAPAPLFAADRAPVRIEGGAAHRQTLAEGSGPGRRALRVSVDRFDPPPSALSFRHEAADELEPWREILKRRSVFCVRARALEPSTTALELVVREADGSAWGTNAPLETQWRDIRIPAASLRHFAHWAGNPAGRGAAGDRLRLEEIGSITICFGAWLYPERASEPHTIEVESVTIE